MDNKQQRRRGRTIAIEALFAFLSRNREVPLSDCLNHILTAVSETDPDPFITTLLETAEKNLGKIKVLIQAFAPEYTYEKIAPINRIILILGITELKFLDTPPVVVINEYVDLAKNFGETKSGGFINGVLDNYRKSLGLDRSR